MTTQIPKLRFPEFEGEWEEKSLGKIAKFSKGKGISKSDIVENGVTECIRYGELYTRYGEVINEVHSKTNVDVKDLVLSEANDVIIPASGETQIDIATASCVIKSGIALSGDLNIIKTTNNGVFLSYYLNNKKKIEIASLAQGISVVHLYSSQLATLNLNLPTLPEQTKIANFLTAIDTKIQQLTKKKALLEEYKKGVMQQLFSGTSARQPIRFKDENGADYPDWEVKKLGDIVTVKSGKYNPEKDKISYKCIELEHITSSTGQLIGFVDSLNTGSIKNKFQKGDVLFSKLRPYLKKYLQAPFEGVCSSEIWVLKGRSVSNDFLYRIIQTDLFIELTSQSSGSKMPRADWSIVENGIFSIPSLPEQTKIANFLTAIDTKLEAVAKQIGQTQAYKKGLLQQLFV